MSVFRFFALNIRKTNSIAFCPNSWMNDFKKKGWGMTFSFFFLPALREIPLHIHVLNTCAYEHLLGVLISLKLAHTKYCSSRIFCAQLYFKIKGPCFQTQNTAYIYWKVSNNFSIWCMSTKQNNLSFNTIDINVRAITAGLQGILIFQLLVSGIKMCEIFKNYSCSTLVITTVTLLWRH